MFRGIPTKGHKGGGGGLFFIRKLTFLILHDNQLKSTPPEGGRLFLIEFDIFNSQ